MIKENQPYFNSIQDLVLFSQKIDGLYDIVVRGTSIDSKLCTPNWSDIDVSIIVEKITPEVSYQVRRIYQQLVMRYCFKISVTLVSKNDYLSVKHHHGIKPLYYSLLLQESISLIQKKPLERKEYDIDELKYDCFSNVVYLIHDLRICHMKMEEDLSSAIQFCRHLLKRAKHLVKNALFLWTGEMNHEINEAHFTSIFTDLDPCFPKRLKEFKREWNSLIQDRRKVDEMISYVFSIVEAVYEKAVLFFAQFTPEKAFA